MSTYQACILVRVITVCRCVVKRRLHILYSLSFVVFVSEAMFSRLLSRRVGQQLLRAATQSSLRTPSKGGVRILVRAQSLALTRNSASSAKSAAKSSALTRVNKKLGGGFHALFAGAVRKGSQRTLATAAEAAEEKAPDVYSKAMRVYHWVRVARCAFALCRAMRH